MCPDVVNTLLKQAGGVAPMIWEDCQKHNLKYYQEVFIVPNFDPKTYEEWYQLLLEIELNPFIQAFHLSKVIGDHGILRISSWEQLKNVVEENRSGWRETGHTVNKFNPVTRVGMLLVKGQIMYPTPTYLSKETNQGCVKFRTQIKQGIESAKQPTTGKTIFSTSL